MGIREHINALDVLDRLDDPPPAEAPMYHRHIVSLPKGDSLAELRGTRVGIPGRDLPPLQQGLSRATGAESSGGTRVLGLAALWCLFAGGWAFIGALMLSPWGR